MANSPTANTHKRCRMHNTHGFMPKTYWEIKEPQAGNMERETKKKTRLKNSNYYLRTTEKRILSTLSY